MARFLVLGGGMIGSAMAMDLAGDHDAEVTVADVRAATLERIAAQHRVRTVRADLADSAAIRRLVADYDLVIGALPSVLGYQTLGAVIEAGRDYVDISFMPENALELDGWARERGVTAVVDCGVAPGVSNMMVGFAATQLDAARLLAAGRFPRPGVHPPEVLGAQPGLLDHVLQALEQRGVRVRHTVTSARPAAAVPEVQPCP